MYYLLHVRVTFYKNNNINKTGTRQCTRAVWSTFAQIHSTLEFPVRICDSHITTHTRPT